MIKHGGLLIAAVMVLAVAIIVALGALTASGPGQGSPRVQERVEPSDAPAPRREEELRASLAAGHAWTPHISRGR